MDILPSSEFRKTFASLTKPTSVTANGHTIGSWIPAGSTMTFETGKDDEIAFLKRQLADRAPVTPTVGPRGGQFNSRPFTPVPKK